VVTKTESNIPEPPVEWVGSLPEWNVYWALLRLGYKDRFTYQSPMMGGRIQKGGAVIDFFVEEMNLAINVQSKYYHMGYTQRIKDELQKAQLESMGIKVIYIQEEDALRNPLYYVNEALKGIEH
jgi:very-short-patch-repair endonuclease